MPIIAHAAFRTMFAREAAEHGPVTPRRSGQKTRSRVPRGLSGTLVLTTIIWVIAGCTQLHNASSPTPINAALIPSPSLSPASRRPVEKTVNASYYGPGFSGRRTANGERFDPNRMTAASKTLPMGSIVHVTDLETGRSVIVRINDRGPYARGRSLDLSRGAARRIGLTHKGVARVRVTPVAPLHPKTATAVPADNARASISE